MLRGLHTRGDPMKRITILLVALLALVVTACGSGEPSESAAASEPAPTVETTPDPTPEPTPEPPESDEPSSSADAGGDSALLDLLPDEINGQTRTDVDPANNPMFAAALAGQDIDISEVEYIVSTYGTGEGVLVASAIRIPGMDQLELEQLGRLMTGVATEGQGSAELTTVGGKEVLAITATEAEQTGYMYFLDGAVIVVGGTSQDLAEEFFSQLP
jgi:hypothetical protein